MDFLKINKNKIKLFLFMFLASLIVFFVSMYIQGFVIRNSFVRFHFSYKPIRYEIFAYIMDLLRHFLISYASITFIRKNISFTGQYYNILKVTLLLLSFGVLNNILRGIFFNEILALKWLQVIMIILNLAIYYLIVCYIYHICQNKQNIKKAT